jgi:small subunit ribosomal protein S4
MTYKIPRVKLSRSIGVALTPKAEAIMQKKGYAPGQHGQRRRPAQSEFGKQLFQKQRLKFQYNVSERFLRSCFAKAKRVKGNTPEALLRILEQRLVTVILRAGFAPTIYAAKQLVSHKHVTVNGKVVNCPNYQIKLEDVVSLREKGKDLAEKSLPNAVIPTYIELDRDSKTAKFLRIPELAEISIQCEPQLVVEYYSR